MQFKKLSEDSLGKKNLRLPEATKISTSKQGWADKRWSHRGVGTAQQ